MYNLSYCVALQHKKVGDFHAVLLYDMRKALIGDFYTDNN